MTTTADDFWSLLPELVEAQKETERRFQETERLLKEQTQENARIFKETERLLKKESKKNGSTN